MATVFCSGHHFTDIHAVFLDKDGTLADVAAYLSQLGHSQAQLMDRQLSGVYGSVLRAHGITNSGLDPAGLLAVGSRQETILATATAAAMVGYPWVRSVDIATATLTTADRQCSPKAGYTPLLPGVLSFLKRLKQANLTVAMVSADSQENLEDFVQYYQLQAYFDQIQGISSDHPAKTAPGFLQAVCQSMGLLPGQGLVIGDSATDLRMATAGGAKGFIGFLGGWQPILSEAAIVHDPNSMALDYGFASEFDQIIVSD